MLKKILSLYLLFFLGGLSAQQKLDSLYGVWLDSSENDSIRIKAFRDYIWDGYLFADPDTALTFANQLLEFSKVNSSKKGIAAALNIKAISHDIKNEYSKSLYYNEQSLKISREIGNSKGIASSLNNIGLIYESQGDYLKALDYYHQSLEIRQVIGDEMGIAGSFDNIGGNYRDQGNYLKAIIYLNKSLDIHQKIGFKKGILNNTINIGLIYAEQGDYTKAIEYYHRSLEISEAINDRVGASLSLHNIGDSYIKQGNYIKALEYQQESLKISEEINDQSGISRSLLNIGSIYLEQDKLILAYESLNGALSLAEEIGEMEVIAFTLYAIGKLSVGQGNHLKAIECCQSSLELAKNIGNVPVQEDSYNCLYTSFKALGNSKKALVYHEQMLELNDSLKLQETSKKLQQMEFAKQVMADSLQQVEKDLQVEMAHQEEVRQKDRNRNLAIGAGIFFLVLSGGFYSRWRYVKKSRAIIEKEKDRSENLLLNILPHEIAEELKLKGSVDAQDFDQVSVLFTDFKGFTSRSEQLTAKELVSEINQCFKAFDHICGNYNIEKIKTIGDAYMAGGGLPVPSDDAVKNTVLAALEMQAFMEQRAVEKKANNEIPFEMRVGIHTGPVVAGIVGVKKFQYDIWGDTVNTASRMESSGEVGKVNISQDTYQIIKDDLQFTFESRGKIKAKGKGEVEMYFVDAKTLSL